MTKSKSIYQLTTDVMNVVKELEKDRKNYATMKKLLVETRRAIATVQSDMEKYIVKLKNSDKKVVNVIDLQTKFIELSATALYVSSVLEKFVTKDGIVASKN